MKEGAIETAIKPLLTRMRSIRQQKEWLINEPSALFNTEFLYFTEAKEAFAALRMLKAEVEMLLLVEEYTANSSVQPKNLEDKVALNGKVKAELQKYLDTILAGLDHFETTDLTEMQAIVFELPEKWTFKDVTSNGFESKLQTSEVALLLHYLKAQGFIVPFKSVSLQKLACLFGKSENTVKTALTLVGTLHVERQSFLNKLKALTAEVENDVERNKRRVTIEKKEPLK